MLLLYWKKLLFAIALAAITAYLYTAVYSRGYAAAENEYKQRIAIYEKKLDDRISTIEKNSTVLLESYTDLKVQSNKEFQAILKATKGRPLYTINNSGVCTPSPDFVKAYNDSVNRANKRK